MPKRPCARPGCSALVAKGYCEKCADKHDPARIAELERPSAAKRGYGRRWQKTSEARLRKHPFCADPFGVHKPFPAPANVTDHIIAHKGDMVLFWDPNNWQSLCWSCNSRKAVEIEGGFGRVIDRRTGAGSNVQPDGRVDRHIGKFLYPHNSTFGQNEP